MFHMRPHVPSFPSIIYPTNTHSDEIGTCAPFALRTPSVRRKQSPVSTKQSDWQPSSTCWKV